MKCLGMNCPDDSSAGEMSAGNYPDDMSAGEMSAGNYPHFRGEK